MKHKMTLCSLARTTYRYTDFGHHAGALIWWLNKSGKLSTFISTGTETHHELNKRMDMDARWRGRLMLEQGIVTLLPPLNIYTDKSNDADSIRIPATLIRALKRLGGKEKRFFVDARREGLANISMFRKS